MPLPLRLICALLTLLLAVPAVQANACLPSAEGHAAHVVAEADAHGSHHGKTPSAPASSQGRHECLGCIPPIDASVYRPVARLDFAFDRLNRVAEMAFPPGLRPSPEPPPPRATV